MKTKIIILALFLISLRADAALLSAGYSFTNGEQVTALKLNNLVTGGSVSVIQYGDIDTNAVGTVNIIAGSVTSQKILSGTILAGNIAQRTILGANMATNSISGTELGYNVSFGHTGGVIGPNIWCFTNDLTTVKFDGPSTTLVFTNGQIPAASVANVVTNGQSLASLVSTNLPSATGSGSTYTWATILTLQTTAANGAVHVDATVTAKDVVQNQFIRIRDNIGNVLSQTTLIDQQASSGKEPMFISANDILAGALKTYYIDVAGSGTSIGYTNTLNATAIAPAIQNGLRMSILQIP